jgi:DNA-binding NarL/FixJ family response regulator
MTTLTPRQLAVARLVADGLTTKGIAAELGVVESTVRVHLHVIAARLGLPERHQTRTLIARWWWGTEHHAV